jgi:hypothetical protein
MWRLCRPLNRRLPSTRNSRTNQRELPCHQVNRVETRFPTPRQNHRRDPRRFALEGKAPHQDLNHNGHRVSCEILLVQNQIWLKICQPPAWGFSIITERDVRRGTAQNLRGFRPADREGRARLSRQCEIGKTDRSPPHKHGVVACFRWLGLPTIFSKLPAFLTWPPRASPSAFHLLSDRPGAARGPRALAPKMKDEIEPQAESCRQFDGAKPGGPPSARRVTTAVEK